MTSFLDTEIGYIPICLLSLCQNHAVLITSPTVDLTGTLQNFLILLLTVSYFHLNFRIVSLFTFIYLLCMQFGGDFFGLVVVVCVRVCVSACVYMP